MFICDDCRKKDYQNAESFSKSFGNCEICRERKICNDIQSKFLVMKSRRKDGK